MNRKEDHAISAYYKITASPKFREVEHLYGKSRRDEAQAPYHANRRFAHCPPQILAPN